MREIKFRGQTWDGEWACGYLFKDDGDRWLIVDKFPMEVNPETVGQYTGLKDKNGREIYEGDIVKIEFSVCLGLSTNREVVFHEGMFCVRWKVGEGGEVSQDFTDGFCYIPLRFFSDIEVIGNIYENAELLEGM